MKSGGLLVGFLVFCCIGHAQNYHAIEGTPYAGGLGLDNNPASIVNTPFPWDLTIFSAQMKNSTNAIRFKPASYFSLLSRDTVHFNVTSGNFRRYAAFNFNIHVLNARLALGRRQSIAFGIDLRGYTNVTADPFNYADTLKDMNQFFNINGPTIYNGNAVTSTFGEIFFSYARTLLDDDENRLNAGITIRASRGISGAFAQLAGGAITRTVQGPKTVYFMNAGSFKYGYSENYDRWNTQARTTPQNLYQFLNFTLPGGSLDLGLEYLVKPQDYTAWDAEDDYYDYDWKIGLSVLDIGAARYEYGILSRIAANPNANVSDSLLDIKFNRARNLSAFNDTMSTLVSSFSTLAGNFTVWNPTRLVLNIDRPLPDHFGLNAGLSLNLTPSNNSKNKMLFVKDMTLLTFVPRWETRNLGAYLPMQVTNEGKVWIGGAFRAGPLLLGVHNWADIFTNSSTQNGGFYVALVLRPGSSTSQKEDKQYQCPKF